MRALDLKLIRDVRRMWAQALAIALVLAAGVATVILGVGAHDSLSGTRTTYYESNRFADVFASVTRAPNGLADWFPDQATTGAPATLVTPPSPLPVPSPTEAYVGRARALFAGGKLRDALRALDRVPVGDALRPDAERLRADIQRELLAVAVAEASSASSIAAPVSPPRE